MKTTKQGGEKGSDVIRPACAEDRAAVLAIINAAAEAYRGVIPADRWHEPYMPAEELDAEIAAGVVFSCYETGQGIAGVMGVQRRYNADLIRHAYVLPERQGHGLGTALIAHLCRDRERPILVGTWRAAEWAIRFYERHGFTQVAGEDAAPLLRTYWTVPERQIATSVVLTLPGLDREGAARLMAGAS
ncbi:GNAT family N-acetyltransferase [Novosphingobium mangrovi (ex Huang et al. 2023)]|uniref:GNAT family N-acetyltransferase n=1 Tax=Novosphingobium mangrovi (ex Huang et al. 2023) TaxID=2976432 RepID=A0ABT2HZZ4_9SPHN|nr:GNAT family N-acetyltransferase [Novosphingobium mangrovi (ex Huang et al. 2023)]MCT2398126.1 GNAT family N-acetyltransferase [Novosphingobium mangrovi (ex Huang et al. 2023)]